MSTGLFTRRRLLLSSLASSAAVRAGLSATALFAAVERVLAAHDEHIEGTSSFTTLAPEEGAVLAAIAARIIPTDETPGATEAGAVYFMDRVLGESRAEWLPALREGLGTLRQAVKAAYGGEDFAALSPGQQDALLARIETTPLFTTVRFLTVAGTFSLPEYGGNRDHVGWSLIGFDHRHVWQAPYGYYDADYMQKGE